MNGNRVPPDPKNTLVVIAAKPESKGRVEKTAPDVLYTGVGKVNAAFKLSAELGGRTAPPRYVINLGTAGSHTHAIRSLVCCTRFFQSDMDATPLEFRKYQTPFETAVELKSDYAIRGLPECDLYTADRFVTDPALGYPAMDMEGYALAKVCGFFGLPFICAKFISDSADEHAVSWADILDEASIEISGLLQEIFAGKRSLEVRKKSR